MWVCPPPRSNSGKLRFSDRDPLLRDFSNPGGHWHPGARGHTQDMCEEAVPGGSFFVFLELERSKDVGHFLREFFRDPQQWDPLMGSFPYHSHIFRDSYGSGMGIVWEASHKGVPLLGVPGITPRKKSRTKTALMKVCCFCFILKYEDLFLNFSKTNKTTKRLKIFT